MEYYPRSTVSSVPFSKLNEDFYDDDDDDDEEDEGVVMDERLLRPKNVARTLHNANTDILPEVGGQLEAQPNVDQQDKLWTEIDALDDVKRLAASSNNYLDFPADFETQLQKVRELHVKLLEAMRERNARLEEEQVLDPTRTGTATTNTTATTTIATSSSTEDHSNADSHNNNTSSGTHHNAAAVIPEEVQYVDEMITAIRNLRSL